MHAQTSTIEWLVEFGSSEKKFMFKLVLKDREYQLSGANYISAMILSQLVCTVCDICNIILKYTSTLNDEHLMVRKVL